MAEEATCIDIMVGYRTLEEAQKVRSSILGDYKIVCVGEGPTLTPMAYIIVPLSAYNHLGDV